MEAGLPMRNRIPLRWRSSCGRYSVWLRKRCLAEMLRMARAHEPAEIGSSLYGCYSSHGRLAVVLGATPVPPDSRSSASWFVRGVSGLAEFFHDLFKSSHGRRHYVGEWHSHPNVSPRPSVIDWARQRELTEDPTMQCPECILIVLGGDMQNASQVGVYVYSHRRGRIVLKPV